MIVRPLGADDPLGELVEAFWYFDTSSDPVRDAQQRAREKVLPTGTFEFVFNLRDDRIVVYAIDYAEQAVELSGAITCGVHSRYFLLDGERRGTVAGVHFRPAGVFPLLRQSAADFTNKHVNLTEIFGPTATAFRRELASLTAADAVFAALETFLTRRADQQRRISPAVARALRMLEESPFRNPGRELANAFGISQKALIEAFKRQVGLTPKKYSRVLRFQEVLKHIGKGEAINWADTAFRCGYYDQAHFNRDFRQFSGFSPGEYRTRLGPNPNHVSAG